MRSTRITALGIVIFLSLQAALSSCLRIGGKPKYDIDEDSLFFSRMPPRTETGANIVAFEFLLMKSLSSISLLDGRLLGLVKNTMFLLLRFE